MLYEKISKIIDELITLQQKELYLMHGGKAHETATLTEAKQGLTIAMNHCFQELSENPDLRQQVTPAQKADLMAKLESLAHLSNQVHDALKNIQETQQSFLEHLKRKAREGEELSNSYSRQGVNTRDERKDRSCLAYSFSTDC